MPASSKTEQQTCSLDQYRRWHFRSLGIPSDPWESELNEIGQTLKRWVDTINNGSVEDVLALYHPVTSLHATFSDVMIRTHDELRDYYEPLKERTHFKIQIFGEGDIKITGSRSASAQGFYRFTLNENGTSKTTIARFTFAYVKDKDLQSGAYKWLISNHHSDELHPPVNSIRYHLKEAMRLFGDRVKHLVYRPAAVAKPIQPEPPV